MQTRNEELQKENDEGKALEGLLRRNEAALRLYVDSIPAMTWTVEPDGRVDFLSRRWLEYSGITLEEGLANPVHGMHPRDAPRAFALWQRCIETRQPFEAEIRLRRADGEYRWFLVRTTPLLDGNGKVLKWFGTSTDIEDRKRAEERLQQLSRRLVELHEDESRDLSRELHDEFGQLLATTGLHLQTARTTSGPEAEASLDRALALLQRAGAQVRGMALELRPTFLESSGLESTLRWLATQHEQRAGLAVRVTGTLGDIPADIAIAGYRVVQQALTNVVQHAHARTVSIQLAQDPSSMHLVIEDDGVGFDVAKTLGDGSGHGQLGLLGMRERVQVFGGTLQIDSRPERGARIAVSIPMAADAVTAGGEESDEDARAAGR
jgi:PAS domain S-box-containing protein